MILNIDLSFESLTRALQEIEAYQKSFNERVSVFLDGLAKFGATVAQDEFGPDVNLTVEKIDDSHYAIVANGDQVCFLEFGTGVYADSTHQYASKVPFDVSPGSWSNQPGHGGHYPGGNYQGWLDLGLDPGDYPYNTLPIRGMLHAYNAMRDRAPQLAREVFGR